jgi:hypothetical protein
MRCRLENLSMIKYTVMLLNRDVLQTIADLVHHESLEEQTSLIKELELLGRRDFAEKIRLIPPDRYYEEIHQFI